MVKTAIRSESTTRHLIVSCHDWNAIYRRGYFCILLGVVCIFFYVSVIWFYFIPFVSYCLLYFYSLLYPSPQIKMSICTFTFSTISNSRHIKISFHMDLSVIAIILHVCIYYIWVLNAAFFFALYCSVIWFTTSSDSEPMVKWAFMIKICMCGLVFLSHFLYGWLSINLGSTCKFSYIKDDTSYIDIQQNYLEH